MNISKAFIDLFLKTSFLKKKNLGQYLQKAIFLYFRNLDKHNFIEIAKFPLFSTKSH